MQFLLLLPELPRARETGLPDRGAKAGRSHTLRTRLISNLTDVAWRRLGLSRAPDRISPRSS
jgi:hypothetical protein